MAFNILIVDDSATTRGMMAKTIGLADVPIGELKQAANGEEALDILQSNWIDLVFTDINMPVMDGMQLIEKMNQDGLLKTVPVILVTIEGSVKRIDNLKAKGVSGFIRKPFTPEQVKEVMDSVLAPKMQKSYAEPLSRALHDVFKGFAFMFSEALEKDDIPSSFAGYASASMTFAGPISGKLLMMVPGELGRELAANALGIEASEDQAQSQSHDALKELINLVCGRALTIIAGEEPLFDMDVPQVETADEGRWKELASDPRTQAFRADDFPVLLQFNVEGHHG